jgi:ankyrin repeat protein
LDHSRVSFYTLSMSDGLLSYAYRSWVAHTHQCGHHSPVLEEVRNLVLNSKSFPLPNSGKPGFGGPLHVAATYGLVDLILPAAQLQSPNALTEHGESPLLLAANSDQFACVKTLLSLPDIDVNVADAWGGTSLMAAAVCDSIECLQLLAEAPGIQINTRNIIGMTALMWAATSGRTEAAKLLLELPGIDVNAKDIYGWTALIRAASMGHTEFVEQILQARDIDVNVASATAETTRIWPTVIIPAGSTALTAALFQGYVDIAKHLLRVPGIDVGVVNEHRETALSYASRNGDAEIADLLRAFPGTRFHDV